MKKLFKVLGITIALTTVAAVIRARDKSINKKPFQILHNGQLRFHGHSIG